MFLVFGLLCGTALAQFPANLRLTDLNGSDGFRIHGENAGDASGYAVAGGGDFNGDGFADILIGAYASNGFTGRVYLLFGTAQGVATDLNLADLDGSNGIIFDGAVSGEQLGYSLDFAGDLNDDGFDDLVIGAPQSNPDGNGATGRAYVIFGSTTFSSPFSVSSLNGNNGFIIDGEAVGDLNGSSVRRAGDLNGDQVADLLVGAPGAEVGTLPDAGKTYVIFGGGSYPAQFDPGGLDGSNGFVLEGTANAEQAGRSLAGGQDLNGDGVDDLVVGAPLATAGSLAGAGKAFVVFGQSNGFAANLNLADLDGSNGFALFGLAAGDNLGTSVSLSPDVNGDGRADLLLGAPWADPGGNSRAGSVYVLYGRATFPAAFDLASLDGSNGMVIHGSNSNDYAGVATSPAGDLNHDGLTDILIGASGANVNSLVDAGQALVVFGGDNLPATLNASALNGSNGFLIQGESSVDNAGFSLALAGDFNQDGADDLLLGAYRADSNGNADAGRSYVVFGLRPDHPSSLDLGELNGRNGFVLHGEGIQDFSGNAVAPAGDLNGDGLGDFVVGARRAGTLDQGNAYVVFGKASARTGELDLANLDGSNGFVIEGVSANDRVGTAVQRAGDINGDGIGDLIIGASGAGPGGRDNAGRAYVVFGHTGAFSASLSPLVLDGSNGFALNGEQAGDSAGIAVSPAGDVNNDGIDDLLVGASGYNSSTGRLYVLFGRTGAFPAELELGSLDGSNGFAIDGENTGDFFASAAGTLDINADGISDIIVGASSANPGNASGAGRVYVIFGKNGVFAHPFSLSTLNGSNGFVVNGEIANAKLGLALARAGDVNGDGIDDAILGAPYTEVAGAAWTGSAFVLFGSDTPFPASMGVNSLDGSNGFRIDGEFAYDLAASTVAGVGDYNQDGVDDVIIGAKEASPFARDKAGKAYIVYGSDASLPAVLKLVDLDGSNGFALNGARSGDAAGTSVALAGDINGDGRPDILIGASLADPHNVDAAGAVHVLLSNDILFTDSFE